LTLHEIYLSGARVRSGSGEGDATPLVALVAGIILDVGASLIHLVDLGVTFQAPLHNELNPTQSELRIAIEKAACHSRSPHIGKSVHRRRSCS
jgi:hypothetical protein